MTDAISSRTFYCRHYCHPTSKEESGTSQRQIAPTRLQHMPVNWDSNTGVTALRLTQPLLILSGGEPPSLAILWPLFVLSQSLHEEQHPLHSRIPELPLALSIHASQHVFSASSPLGTCSGYRQYDPGST